MNNLSKLLDDGTLKIKKINMGKPNKIKTYKKMMKQTKKKKRNKKYSPKIIIKKQPADSSKSSDNKQKIIKRVIDQPKQKNIIKEIDNIVNKEEKQANKKNIPKKSDFKKIKDTIDNDKLKDMNISSENKSEQVKQAKIQQTKSKKKKKVKKYDTQTMIEKLKQKGILVSGKNKKLVKDIYLYALDDQIKIYRK
jgi:hypothetical protein